MDNQNYINPDGYVQSFVDNFDAVQADVNRTAHKSGFYNHPSEDGTRIALIHSELSECLEYLRHGNPESDHIAPFSGAEEELADVVIRIMDFAQEKGFDVGAAIEAKRAYNKTRPYLHGGKAF